MEKQRLQLNLCVILLMILCTGLCECQQSVDPLVQARALLSAGKLGESEAALRAYLETHPASADAHFLLGYVLFRDQKAKESLAEFTAGAKYTPRRRMI